MYIEWEALPKESRIWIYQSNKKLDKASIDTISEMLLKQISCWTSHGAELKGSFKFFFEQILVIAVDQNYNAPSGCSIDTSSRWLKEIGQLTGIDFFDRSLPFFNNDQLCFAPLFEVKKYILDQRIMAESLILNQQINKIGQLDSHWKIKAKDSYLKRHFENLVV